MSSAEPSSLTARRPIVTAEAGRQAGNTPAFRADSPIELAINGRFLSQPTTGVQRVARELVRAIDQLVAEGDTRFRLRLLCPHNGGARGLALRATEIEEIAGPGGHLWEQLMMPAAIGDARLLCLGNSAPLIPLWRGRPVTLLIHDLSYRVYPSAYRRSYRIIHALMMPTLLRRAAPIITVSETERHMLEAFDAACQGKVVVAQNGGWREGDEGDSVVETRSPDVREGDRFVLYVGSLSSRKNIQGVLELAVRLWRESAVRSVIVGSVQTTLAPPALDVPADARGAIRFLGQIEDRAALARLYRQAACLVFPSFYEASPLPPLEAMHFGCPVVASDIPSLRERCGDAAEYCDPTDIADMLAAIRRVIDDPARARTLVRRGDACRRDYSWRHQARVILDAIARNEPRSAGSGRSGRLRD